MFSGSLVFAYFLSYSNEKNTFTIAENTIEVSEDYVPPVEQTAGEVSFRKEISVVNTGNVECYVRVYADFSESDIRARSCFSNDAELTDSTAFYSAVREPYTPNTYVNRLPTVAPGWVFIPDNSTTILAGFYYYT